MIFRTMFAHAKILMIVGIHGIQQIIGSVLTEKGETYMKTEFDGFKIFEDRDDYHQCIVEMYNNELLLREKLLDMQTQIDDLKKQLNYRRTESSVVVVENQ